MTFIVWPSGPALPELGFNVTHEGLLSTAADQLNVPVSTAFLIVTAWLAGAEPR